MAEIIISNHAQQRLYERGIDVHQVKKAAKNGTIVKQDRDGTIMTRFDTDNGEKIEVVYKKDGKKYIIITAYKI